MLVRLRRVEVTHLAGYDVHDDGTDGCHVCFAAQEYATGLNMQLLDGALLCVTEVFLLTQQTGAQEHYTMAIAVMRMRRLSKIECAR